MKKLILVLLCALMFVGCAKATYDGKEYGAWDIVYLEAIAESRGDVVYKDKHTGVLYYGHGQGISPIMEGDGTCLTYDEWLLRIKDNK